MLLKNMTGIIYWQKIQKDKGKMKKVQYLIFTMLWAVLVIGFAGKKIVIPSKINGQTVIGIWNNVFEKCTNLEDVVFQEGCKYIGKNVFTNCSNLQKVTLPKSLL